MSDPVPPPIPAAPATRWSEDRSWRPRLAFTAAHGLAAYLVCVAAFAAAKWDLADGVGTAAAVVLPAAVVAAGAVIVDQSRRGSGFRRRLGRARVARHGGERWWFDREWRPAGETRAVVFGFRPPRARSGGEALQVAGLIFVLVGGPVVAFLLGDAAGLGGFVAAVALVACARWRWRGDIVVSWTDFPQFTGGTATFLVGTSSGGARIDGARIWLRCVREEWRYGRRGRKSIEAAWFPAHGVDPDEHIGPEVHVRATFDLPPDVPGTSLESRPAVYWELVVQGHVGAREYTDRVLVPVYTRPPE